MAATIDGGTSWSSAETTCFSWRKAWAVRVVLTGGYGIVSVCPLSLVSVQLPPPPPGPPVRVSRACRHASFAGAPPAPPPTLSSSPMNLSHRTSRRISHPPLPLPTQWGGAIYIYDSGEATLTSCTLYGNSASNVSGGVCLLFSLSSIVSPTHTRPPLFPFPRRRVRWVEPYTLIVERRP